MVTKLRVKDGILLSRDVPPQVDSFRTSRGQSVTDPCSDELAAGILEDNGWKLVNVFPVAGSTEYDKELWFRKD